MSKNILTQRRREEERQDTRISTTKTLRHKEDKILWPQERLKNTEEFYPQISRIDADIFPAFLFSVLYSSNYFFVTNASGQPPWVSIILSILPCIFPAILVLFGESPKAQYHFRAQLVLHLQKKLMLLL